MRTTMAFMAATLATAAFGQGQAFYGPFTDAEAQLLSAVWGAIRNVEDYEAIDWPAYGLARAPGSTEVRRAMATQWDELRRAQRFEQIDWNRVVRGEQRSSRGQIDRFEEQFPGPFTDVGPFTRDEAAILSRLWPELRETEEFADIDWRAHGLERAPGDADARRILAASWSEVRREARFEEIDWDEVVDERELASSRRHSGGFDVGSSPSTGPFTQHEAALMSQVWRRIREVPEYEAIDWGAVGLSEAPGDRAARRIMAENWQRLREAERFEDVDWATVPGRQRRLLR